MNNATDDHQPPPAAYGHHKISRSVSDPPPSPDLDGAPPISGWGTTPRLSIEAAAASDTDECMIWPHGYDNAGYGVVWWEGRTQRAHRAVLELVAGAPPRGHMVAAHQPVVCHTRACINPRHLRWATVRENALDQVLDGTRPNVKGEAHGRSRLTNQQVVSIFTDSRHPALVAAEYGVSTTHVVNIKAGKRWGHLTSTLEAAV